MMNHRRGLNRIHLELRKVSFIVASDSPQKNVTYTNTLGQDFRGHQKELSASLHQHYQGLDHRLDRHESLLLQQRSMEESNHCLPQQQNLGSRATNDDAHIEAVRIQIARHGSARCRNWCPCVSHSQKKSLASWNDRACAW